MSLKHNNFVKISIVGDVMVGGILSSEIEEFKNIFLSDKVRKSLESDITFCNLECPLAKNDLPLTEDKILLHARKNSAELLKSAGFNVVSLANNHIMDFGYDSVKKTIELLRKNNIQYTGVGQNLLEARRPTIFNKDDLKIAFLAYSAPETWGGWSQRIKQTNKGWFATIDTPGVAPFNLELVKEDIIRVKKKSDFIVVSVHWGEEYTHFPHPKILIEAHKIIDAGANLIVGHHPHALQGYEQYHNGLIMYSLSNFLFPTYYNKGELRKWNQECRESVILQCNVSKNKIISYKLVPVIQKKDTPVVITPPHGIRNEILLRIRSLSNEYKRSNYGERYTRLKKKENKFRNFKRTLKAAKTYGLVRASKKIMKKMLENMKRTDYDRK